MIKRINKILAFTLALVMVVGFAPVGLFATADAAWAGAENSTVVSFITPSWSVAAETTKNGYSEDIPADATYADNSTADKGFKFHSISDAGSANLMRMVPGSKYVYLLNLDPAVTAVYFKYPSVAGTYTMKMNILPNGGTGSPDIAVYSLPVSTPSTDNAVYNLIANKDASAVLLGTAVVPTTTGTDLTYVKIATIEVTQEMAGQEGLFAFQTRGGSKNNHCGRAGAYFSDIMFDGAAPVIESVELSSSNNLLVEGVSAQLSVTGTLVGGEAADLSAAEVVYSTTTPNVVSLNASTGAFTAIGEGTAELSVSVSLGGATATDTLSIYVDAYYPDYAGEDATKYYDYGNAGWYSQDANAATGKLGFWEASSPEAAYTDNVWRPTGGVKKFKFHSIDDGEEGISQTVKFWNDQGNQAGSANDWKSTCYFTAVNSKTALNTTITLPTTAGIYGVNFRYIRQVEGASEVTFYSIPANTARDDVRALLTDANKIGTAKLDNSAGDGAGAWTDAAVGDLVVTPAMAGQERIIAMVATASTGESGAWTGMYGYAFRGIELNGLGTISFGETEVSAGWYGDTADIAAAEEGAVAFNAFFKSYENYEVESYGMYVYTTDTAEDDKVEVTSSDITSLVIEGGKFFVLVETIAAANFESDVIAVPYVVIDGEVTFGDTVTATVAAGNWLGAK